MEKKIKELLDIGEDNEARENLSNKLQDIISKSLNGEIGLAEYIEGLEKVLTEAKEYKEAFNNNYK